MHLAVLADELIKEEFLSKPLPPEVSITFADSLRSLEMIEADAFFDLCFTPDPERINKIGTFNRAPFFVNEITCTALEMNVGIIRINAWPTFFQRPVTEIAFSANSQKKLVERIFGELRWSYQVVPDIPGFITCRIIAAIINEAYFTLGDGVSSREEIDLAMKLGTNYPYGPFEWGQKIGLDKVVALLYRLSSTDARYIPAPALEMESWSKALKGK